MTNPAVGNVTADVACAASCRCYSSDGVSRRKSRMPPNAILTDSAVSVDITCHQATIGAAHATIAKLLSHLNFRESENK